MNKLVKNAVVISAAFVIATSNLSFINADSKPSPTLQKSKSSVQKVAPQSANFEILVKDIASKIKTNWPYMNKIWPTYNYNNHNLILFCTNNDGSIKQVWLINAKQSKKLTPAQYKNLDIPQPGGYEQIQFDKKPSISMTIVPKDITEKDSANEIYLVATHEIVHFYYQQDAYLGKNGGSRVQSFPIIKEPRLYRQMIYKNLINAVDKPESESEYLGKAKYWLDKYKSEFKKEYEEIKSTDIAEATARYTDRLSIFTGSSKDDTPLYKKGANLIKRDELFMSADSESYEIGYVAALILDKNKPNWKNNFYKEHISVEEKLLKDIKPIKDEINPQLQTKLNEVLDKHNSKVEKSFKNLIQAESNKSIPYLKIDISKSDGSILSTGSVEYKGNQISTNYSNKFYIGKSSIAISDDNVIEKTTPDEKSYIYVPLTMKYTLKSNILNVQSKKLNVNSVKVKTIKENNRTMYFVVVDK